MSLADNIRAHVMERHLLPASRAGAERITLRAGDIHSELRLQSRMPAICSVMGGKKLIEQSAVVLEKRTGPKNGANVYFTYRLDKDAIGQNVRQAVTSEQTRRSSKPKSLPIPADGSKTPAPVMTRGTNGAGKTLFLVSCVKRKLDRPALAKDIYTSTFFTLARKMVEKNGADWRILSAKYNLLDPDRHIQPYELTLNSMPVAERKLWAARVWHDLAPLVSDYQRVVILAGQSYREFLADKLDGSSAKIEIPMAGLRQGEQLAWLSQQ